MGTNLYVEGLMMLSRVLLLHDGGSVDEAAAAGARAHAAAAAHAPHASHATYATAADSDAVLPTSVTCVNIDLR